MARKTVALDDITYKNKKYFIGQTVYVDEHDIDKLVKLQAIQPVEEKKTMKYDYNKKVTSNESTDDDQDSQNQPKRKKFNRIKE
jgi:hypothetical protein